MAQPRTFVSRRRALSCDRWICANLNSRTAVIVGVLFFGFWAIAYATYFGKVDQPIGPHGRVIGGDFICFYGAGRIVYEGAGRNLYDHEVQRSAQMRASGADEDYEVGPYVNPPTWAIAIAPICALPYVTAFHIHTGLMLIAFLVGMNHLRKHVSLIRHHPWPVYLLMLTFFPMVRSITGGQNTALLFLILAFSYGALQSGQRGWAGLWLGLLLYKPQYALPLLGLLLLRGHFRTVAVAGCTGVAHYAIGAAVCGWDWPLRMAHELSRFVPQDFAYNGALAISIPAVCTFSLPAGIGQSVGLLLAGAFACWMVGVWAADEPHSGRFAGAFALAIAGSLAISPHSYFYDAGLLALGAVLLADATIAGRGDISAAARLALAFGYLLAFGFRIAETIGFQPLALLPIGVMIASTRLMRSQRATRATDFVDVKGSANPVSIRKQPATSGQPA